MIRTAEQVRSDLRNDVEFYESVPGAEEFTQRQKGAITGTINRELGKNDLARRVILCWLFRDSIIMGGGEMHFADLTDGQWFALRRWIDARKDDTGKWYASSIFTLEIKNVALLALTAYINFWGEHVDVEDSVVAEAVRLGGIITSAKDDPGELELYT